MFILNQITDPSINSKNPEMYNVKRVRYVTEVCLITFHHYIKCFKQYNVVEIVFKDVHKIPFM